MDQFSYRRHRFPASIIQQAVWLYLRFTLSYRGVEDLLAERRLDISYETVRRWVLKFGPLIACKLRQRRPRLSFGREPRTSRLRPGPGLVQPVFSTPSRLCRPDLFGHHLAARRHAKSALLYGNRRAGRLFFGMRIRPHSSIISMSMNL
jgi:hypothetical protein